MTDPIKQALEGAIATLERMDGWLKARIHIGLVQGEYDVISDCRAALKGLEKAEPVAEVVSKFGDPEAFGEREISVIADLKKLRYGTKLFTHPAPVQAEPGFTEGWNAAIMKARSICDKWGVKSSILDSELICQFAAAPQPAAPVVGLTDEQIDSVTTAQWGKQLGVMYTAHRTYARAIEAAHGIKPPEKAGAAPKRQHITDGTPCWCEPELHHKDPETGAEVWVHRGIQ